MICGVLSEFFSATRAGPRFLFPTSCPLVKPETINATPCFGFCGWAQADITLVLAFALFQGLFQGPVLLHMFRFQGVQTQVSGRPDKEGVPELLQSLGRKELGGCV